MNKTPKAYRDDLAKDFGAKRKDANEKIKRIQDNPDFLESHKDEAIKVVKDNLYKELDDARGTEEYKDAKSKKQTLRGKKKEVKKQEEIVAEQKKLLGEKEDELNKMNEEYGERTEKKESKETGKITYEHLFNKPNMTAKDKENMEKSIKFLVDNKMDNSENLKKLEAINYGADYREIGGVKFSRENLIPEVKFNDKPNQYNVFESKEKGIYKTIYNGKSEHYLTTDAYIVQAEKQGKKAIKDTHIRKALQALPGEFSNNNWYEGANIMGNILDLSMSGYVNADGRQWNKDGYGYLCSASPVDEYAARAFDFDKDGGELYDNYFSYYARPCLFVVE